VIGAAGEPDGGGGILVRSKEGREREMWWEVGGIKKSGRRDGEMTRRQVGFV
jgi:hypothetical protein